MNWMKRKSRDWRSLVVLVAVSEAAMFSCRGLGMSMGWSCSIDALVVVVAAVLLQTRRERVVQ